MKPPVERNLQTLLFNPFAVIAGAQALLFGIAAVLIAAVVGYMSSAQFDGVLDLHFHAQNVFWLSFAEGIVDWLCLALVLLLMGRIASRTPFRSIDLLGTQALARWPSVGVGLIASIPAYQRHLADLVAKLKMGDQIPSSAADTIVFGAITLCIVGFVCWMVMLMYRSYRVSCNIQGGKSVVTFFTGLVLAESLSKIAIYWLVKFAVN